MMTALDPLTVAREQCEKAAQDVIRANADAAERVREEMAARFAQRDDPKKRDLFIRATADRVGAEDRAADRASALATARAEVARLEHEAMSRACATAVDGVTSLYTRLAPALAKLAALYEEASEVIEHAIADEVLTAQSSFDEAVRLEQTLQPAVDMAARGITRPTLVDMRFVAQVYLGHARRVAGRDDLANGWMTAIDEPKEGSIEREAWDRALLALGLVKKGAANVL